MRARIAALATLAVAVLAVILILGGGDPYKVTGHFENASQLVGGEVVVIGGVSVGGVEEIELGDDNEALVTFTVEDDFAPLPRGTVATVRSFSLSGIANRQIQLELPSEGEAGEAIPDGGDLEQTETVSEVDLDELFNTLDPETVKDLKKVIKGFADSYDGVGKPANKGFRYLNPFLSTSRRVFDELNRDQPTLERLIVDADRLSGALAERRDNVAGLISNSSTAMGALAAERTSLATAIAELPSFMRQFNTTAVNLRAALDDVDPLVDASKPVAEPLREFLTELNSASENLVPTISDLNRTIDVKGKRDLVGLTALTPRLAKIAVGPVERNGAERQGAFPESVEALRDSIPLLEQLRPYTPDLVGWFDDFGHSGVIDSNGGVGRFSLQMNAFSPGPGGIPLLDPSGIVGPTETLGLYSLENNRRCPGSLERPAPDGSNPFTDGGNVACDPTQLPVGD